MAVFTLVGDLVGSKRLPDRAGIQSMLGEVLARVNTEVHAVQPLEPTVGDEFQGAFSGLGDAVIASLLVRLALLPTVDVRCGLGFGDVEVFDASRTPLLQDGPGWWAARSAIDALVERSKRPRAAFLRTWFADRPSGSEPVHPRDGSSASLAPGMSVVTVNAFLTCRDQIVGRLKPDGLDLLRLSLLGATQAEMGASMGISQSAVSQRLDSSGINALKDAHDLMRQEWA